MFDEQAVDIGAASSSPDVVKAVETAGDNDYQYVRDGIFYATSGVKLRLKKVPRMVVVEAGMKITLPKPPKIYIPEQERDEENPLDPDYIDERAKASFYKGIASTNVYMSLGTEIILPLPEGIDPPDGDNWAQDLLELGISVPDKSVRRSRYVAWLRLYALGDDDFTALSKATAVYSGHVTEAQVASIEESFRNQAPGDSDKGSTPTSKN